MFRGSAYSIETQRDLSLSGLAQQNIKIALVGMTDTGKSSIINCMEKQKFKEDFDPTTSFQLRFKKIKINQQLMVNLTIWDASGIKMQQYLKDGKLKKFHGILYVYDLSNPISMSYIHTFHQILSQDKQADYISILVGNKADLVVVKDKKSQLYKIPPTTPAFSLGQKFCQKHKMLHQNVSAKYNTHVTDCFVLLITEILNKKRQLKISRFEEQEVEVQGEENGARFCRWNCQWEKCQVM